jgi:putative oxidoreductase
MKAFRLVAVWILQFGLAAFFAIQGAVKLGGSKVWITRFGAWGYPDHFYLVVGLTEVFGAILLLVPRTAELGVLLLVAVMIGATVTHLIHHEPQVATTLVLTALLVVVLYLRRGRADARASQASRTL